MFHRPPDLPALRQREMTDDGPYIGSNAHNGLMMWLYGLLRQLERGSGASWRVANLLDMDIPWDDGQVDRLRADIMIYPIFIDPNLEVLDIGKAGPPTLVLEVAIPADAFAQAVALTMSQPEEVDVNEILFRPTRQDL
jgi:hypothetical protein